MAWSRLSGFEILLGDPLNCVIATKCGWLFHLMNVCVCVCVCSLVESAGWTFHKILFSCTQLEVYVVLERSKHASQSLLPRRYFDFYEGNNEGELEENVKLPYFFLVIAMHNISKLAPFTS